MSKTVLFSKRSIFPFILFLFLSFQGIGATYTSIQNGMWGDGSSWDRPGDPGCTVTDDIVITDTITCSCNPLDIKGNGSITVKDGGKLIVTSSTGITGSGSLTVENGGELEVQGDLDINGTGNFTVNGTASVSGDLTVSGSGSANGSGDLYLGGSGCSNYTGSGTCEQGTTLPVEFISLEGECESSGEVRLKWATASEKENSHFLVHRAVNDASFKVVGTVEGNGTTSFGNEYAFFDRPEVDENSTIYYKIQQVDMDGSSTFYGPMALRMENRQEEEVDIYPNPVEAPRMNVSLPDIGSSEVTLRIVDMQGRVMMERMVNSTSGSSSLQLDIGSLSQGVYLFQAFDEGGYRSSKRFSVE